MLGNSGDETVIEGSEYKQSEQGNGKWGVLEVNPEEGGNKVKGKGDKCRKRMQLGKIII